MDHTPRSSASAATSTVASRKRKEPPVDSDAAAPQANAAAPPQPTDAAAAAAAAAPALSQPSTAILVTPRPTHPMLRCLSTCRDVQFVLMQLLQLEDLAALDATCRRWREWLLHQPLLDGLAFHRDASPQLLSLTQCDWARQLVTSVCVEEEDYWALLPEGAVEWVEQSAYRPLLALLPRFTRLQELELCVCDTFDQSPDWSMCFTELCGTLWRLDLTAVEDWPAHLLNGVLAHVALLQNLEALVIIVPSASNARKLDLSQLPRLPLLNEFHIEVLDEEGEQHPFRCRPKQVQSLAQCRRLMYLNCGSWSPRKREVDRPGWQLRSAQQRIADGIATLARGLASADEPSADSSSSSAVTTSADAAAAPCALRDLYLDQTVMSAAVWEHVSQLNSLTELDPNCWRSDLSPQQWTRLANFTQLKSIHIKAHPTERSNTPLRTDHFLAPLLRCTQLTTIWLDGSTLSLNAAQLEGIARLPQLRWLLLDSVEIESVAPLASAHKLEAMFLQFCRSPPAVVDFRRSLPPLPSLTFLRLDDRDRITEAQAAPLNAGLLGRMPKLTAERFMQNLRQ